jgi:hypothetical protein
MPMPSETAPLSPPTSVVKIVGFLADVRARQSLGGSLDLNQAWDAHDISVNHVDGFLRWLNIDRIVKPPRELDLAQPPVKSLAKKTDEEPKGEVRDSDAPKESGQEPAINIHLWNALFRPESRRRRRDRTHAPSRAAPNRAIGFAQGYNGNMMLASMAMTGQDQLQPLAPPVKGSLETDARTEIAGAAVEFQALREAPLVRNGLASQAFGHRVANRAEGISPLWNEPLRRNLVPDFGLPDMKFKPGAGTEPSPAVEVADPLYGQVTLIAPPFTVSPDREQGAAVGLKFDWRDIAKGAGQVDYAGMRTIAKTLPEGARVLYPAIDPRKLRGGAVNLKLEPKFAVDLAEAGYGNQVRVDGRKSARLAADWYGGTPPVRLLPAAVTQLPRIARKASGVNDRIPAEPNRRMRILGFHGIPVFFSPRLNTAPDLEQETRASGSAGFAPRSPIISPMQFSGLRSSLLGGFYGVDARPAAGLVRGVQPGFDAASLALSGLLSRGMPAGLGAGVARAAAPVGRFASQLPVAGAIGGAVGRFGAPGLAAASMAIPRSVRAGSTMTSSMPGSPPIGSAPAGEVPRFIRHEASATGSRAPAPFRPTIPSMPQAATAARGQSDTAPQAAGPTTRISPQFNVSAERQPSQPRTMPAKQSMPSEPPAQRSAPMEGAKPARAPMIPQATSPRPTTPQSAQRVRPDVSRTNQPKGPETPERGPGLRPPSMLVAPAKAVPALKADHEPLAIQTSTSGQSGAAGESAATRSAEVAEKKESGLPGSEINLLANEVWVLLKRKLSFEAQRMGK